MWINKNSRFFTQSDLISTWKGCTLIYWKLISCNLKNLVYMKLQRESLLSNQRKLVLKRDGTC